MGFLASGALGGISQFPATLSLKGKQGEIFSFQLLSLLTTVESVEMTLLFLFLLPFQCLLLSAFRILFCPTTHRIDIIKFTSKILYFTSLGFSHGKFLVALFHLLQQKSGAGMRTMTKTKQDISTSRCVIKIPQIYTRVSKRPSVI